MGNFQTELHAESGANFNMMPVNIRLLLPEFFKQLPGVILLV